MWLTRRPVLLHCCTPTNQCWANKVPGETTELPLSYSKIFREICLISPHVVIYNLSFQLLLVLLSALFYFGGTGGRAVSPSFYCKHTEIWMYDAYQNTSVPAFCYLSCLLKQQTFPLSTERLKWYIPQMCMYWAMMLQHPLLCKHFWCL